MKMITFLEHLRGLFNIQLKSGTVQNAIIQSIYDSFIMVDGDIELMRLEMCLSTASGVWLDYWGDFFTVYRKSGEPDDIYARRIIEHVIRPKTTIPAIKSYIVEYLNDEYQTTYTNEDVSIKEPWRDIGKLSHKGLLSKDTLFYSNDYYRHAVLDISIPEKLTQELTDLVHSVKAAGVKIIWSFLNSYGIVTGFNEVNWAQADYHRWTQTQTQRNIASGLVLSNSSVSPYLSGHREIWFELINTYYWYAKMLDKQTDDSILITKLDLIKMLDHYKVIETLFNVKDSGLRLSDTLLSGDKSLSGDLTETELVERLITISNETLDKIKFLDDWLVLSQEGALSQDGTMFEFQTSHEIFCNLYEKFKEFKANNMEYYNILQPPLITTEHIAKWYAKPHINWMFDTPTMTQQDFYELWEMADPDDTLDKIYGFEQVGSRRYLTFADVYQPPIVIAGSPWDWTPVLDIPWLWKSETLNNDELEEIYRTKFSNLPDRVEMITELTTHPENAFTLSGRGVMSEADYNIIINFETYSIEKLTLSAGALDVDRLTGKQGERKIQIVPNDNFDGYNFLSGQETTVTKRRVVTENLPTLGTLIELEENQDVGYTNEDIDYSTRDWFQAPVQIGDYVQWLVLPHTRQLWNTKVMSNIEIRSFWESAEGQGAAPENFKDIITADETIYQPPIVMADTPFYWLNDHIDYDNEWLWTSCILNNSDWEQIYWQKVKGDPTVFPDMIISKWVTPTYPQYAFRLSDNSYMPNQHIDVTYSYTYHPEDSFILSHNSVISNRKTETRYTVESVSHPDNLFRLSDSKMSEPQKYKQSHMEYHPEDNFILSQSTLNSQYQMSGGNIQLVTEWIDNPVYQGEMYLSGQQTEIIRTPYHITYDQLKLTYMSGTPTTQTVEYVTMLDNHTPQRLSGTQTQPVEEITVLEKPITLGKLIELEENQELFDYSLRYISQTPVDIGERAQWLVQVDYNQLWNTPVITKQDLMSLWIGEKPKSYRSLGKLLRADTIIYQSTIEIDDSPYYGFIPALVPYKLWDTPAISNTKIARHWEGTPVTEYAIKVFIQTSPLVYQPPIEMSYKIEMASVNAAQRPLWSSPTMTNEELYSWYEGPKVTPGIFEQEYKAAGVVYQPPIVMAVDPERWLNDHTVYDNDWLWNSSSLCNEDLEGVYCYQYPDGLEITLGKMINLEESNEFKYSVRGDCQSIITTENNVMWMVTMLQNKLWDTVAISNKGILSYWEGNDKPSLVKYKRRYLAGEPYYTLPIIIDDGIKNWTVPHQEWLWKSAALNNEDLNEVYKATLKTTEPILKDILTYDERRSNTNVYSLRSNFQPTIEIIPQ